MDDLSFSFTNYQKQVDNWVKKYGVRYFSELTNLGILMEETGELARLMARIYGEQSFKDGENQSGLGDELADILFVLTCIANQCGIDLTQAAIKNFQKKTKRDKDRHNNNPKLQKEKNA